jgi:DNA processing protein
MGQAEKMLECSEKLGVKVIVWGDKDYPRRALDISDRPLVLYFKGDISVINCDRSVALVGARHPHDISLRMARRIGQRCAENGSMVVSGLAEGCDTEAHEGCLEANGTALGVLAHGLDTIFPKKNIRLAENILNTGGCLVSEYPIETGIRKHQFVCRDRLQAMFSDRTIMVEASETGGSMHAAVYAVDKLNRPLAVVSNNKQESEEYSGNRKLLQSFGAFPLGDHNDLVSFLNLKSG